MTLHYDAALSGLISNDDDGCGTDFGFPTASSTPVDAVLQAPGLTADEQAAILGGNAARLLKLK